MARPSVSKLINQANLLINNSLGNSEIMALVAKRGVTEAKLTGGKALLEAAQASLVTQDAGIGAKTGATARLLALEAEARTAFQDLKQSCKQAFKDDVEMQTALELKGMAPLALDQFLVAAYKLFDQAAGNAAAQAALEAFGYTPQFLADERAKIAALDQANRAQEAAKGAAEGGTLEQNQALKDLQAFVSQYLVVAKIALRARPDLQEMIGIKARNQKTAVQIAAEARAAKPPSGNG